MGQKVLITSIGRTATSSLNALLNQLPNVSSYHERGTGDPYFLCLSRYSAYQNFCKDYLNSRDLLANKSEAEFYVEVNPYFRFADVDHLKSLGWNIIFLVRHPKTYLESVFNRALFTDHDRSFQKLPSQSDPFYDNWDTSSRFEKLCWYYHDVHTHILAKNQPIITYESLSEGVGLAQLLEQIGLNTKVDRLRLPYLNKSEAHNKRQFLRKLLGRPTNMGAQLQWTSLSAQELNTYQKLCKPLITKLGYELQ